MTDLDRSQLPIRRPSFGGTANRTLAGSQPDWNLIGHPTPPEGAPNVLLVLIDDAGFGNPSTFGGPIETPNFTRMAEGGVRYNRFHVTAICSPTRAALLTGRNSHAVGFGSVGEFAGGYPGLLRHAAARRRAPARDPAGQRLQHRGLRQVAPDARRPAGPGRTLRSLAERLGLRVLLRLPGRRRRPVGHGHRREPEDHRCRPALWRRHRPVLPAGRDGGQDHRVAPWHPCPGRHQALLRLLLDRLQPRAASRRGVLGRQVQGPLRPGLGPAARGDLRPPAGARRGAARTRS